MTLREEIAETLWDISTLGSGMDDFGAATKEEQELEINKATQSILEAIERHKT